MPFNYMDPEKLTSLMVALTGTPRTAAPFSQPSLSTYKQKQLKINTNTQVVMHIYLKELHKMKSKYG